MYCIETSLNLADLWDALVKFVETSCVGDFEVRLKMIKSFHVEMATVESTVITSPLYFMLVIDKSCFHRYAAL